MKAIDPITESEIQKQRFRFSEQSKDSDSDISCFNLYDCDSWSVDVKPVERSNVHRIGKHSSILNHRPDLRANRFDINAAGVTGFGRTYLTTCFL